MFGLFVTIIALSVSLVLFAFRNKLALQSERRLMKIGSGAFLALGLVFGAANCLVTVDAGHTKVAKLFGKVQDVYYTEGLHLTNPLYSFEAYDCRDKTLLEQAGVPSQDKLITTFDINLQFSLIKGVTPQMLKTVGSAENMINVHVKPKFRSAIREIGKTVERADDFYLETVQKRLQVEIKSTLTKYLQPLGVEVRDVLIRRVELPQVLVLAVQAKKQREVEVEKQQAELDRFRIEQQQKVEQAEAELEAAEKDAAKIRTLADAEAYKITEINKAIQENPAYIKLQALESLKAISKDSNSKLYFLNSDSPNPLPLMHLGDK